MGHLVVYKCSSFGLVHLTALGRPVRLKFLYLSFSSNYVMLACIVLMLFHQKDFFVLLPALCSKCWILQIPHQDLQCCNSSSSPSIPREETYMTKKTFYNGEITGENVNLSNDCVSHYYVFGQSLVLYFTIICKLILFIPSWHLKIGEC